SRKGTRTTYPRSATMCRSRSTGSAVTTSRRSRRCRSHKPRPPSRQCRWSSRARTTKSIRHAEGGPLKLRPHLLGGPSQHAELAKRRLLWQVLHAAVGSKDQALGIDDLQRASDSRDDDFEIFHSALVRKVDHADDELLGAQRPQHAQVHLLLGRLHRDLLGARI